jgi:hypothetical protein
VAWTVVANTARHSAEAAKAAAAAAAKAGHPVHATAAQAKSAATAIYDHALSVGFSRGFEVSAGIMLIALIVAIAFAGGPAAGLRRRAAGFRRRAANSGTLAGTNAPDAAHGYRRSWP